MHGMPSKPGNMAQVYRAYTEMEEIINAAETSMAVAVERAGIMEAEIVQGSAPSWYIVLPFAGCEAIAARHLVRRRFGIYQPVLDKRINLQGGRTGTRKEPMFPGYIFAFVWDIDKHYQRIRACPGVCGFLVDGKGNTVAMPDRFIRRMMVEEFISEGLGQTSRRFRKRYRNEPIKPEPQSDDGGLDVVIGCKSYWSEAPDLEAEGRKQLLHKALGLVA